MRDLRQRRGLGRWEDTGPEREFAQGSVISHPRARTKHLPAGGPTEIRLIEAAILITNSNEGQDTAASFP